METRYNSNHHAGSGPEERIASRLKNSGAGAQPNVTTKQGEGAQRVYHNIHGAGHPIAPGTQPPKDAGR